LALSPEEFQKREEEFLSSLANSLLKEMSSEEIEQLIKKLMEDAIQQMTILSIFEEGGLEPVFLERIVRLLSLLKPLHFIGKTTY
jgi:hypothetical protein